MLSKELWVIKNAWHFFKVSGIFIFPKNKNITIFGKGNQTRTFCYISDNLEVIDKILNDGYILNDVINIGNDKEYTILELANLIISKTNSQSKIIHLPPLKDGDMSRRKPDITKMLDILNKPLIPLEEGIEKLINI